MIPKNEGLLLSVDPGVDITDDVIKILREKHPVVAAAIEYPSRRNSRSVKRQNGRSSRR